MDGGLSVKILDDQHSMSMRRKKLKSSAEKKAKDVFKSPNLFILFSECDEAYINGDMNEVGVVSNEIYLEFSSSIMIFRQS